MIAIISTGDYTAQLQLPAERRQIAGVLSYLGANHATDYDIKYSEDSGSKLWFALDCHGVVENAIAKVIPVGFRFHALNDTIALLNNLPYQNRRELENTVKVEGLASYEQFSRMLTEAYPQSVTTKYYCPLTIQVHSTDCWGDMDEEGYEEDAEFAARHEDLIRQQLIEYPGLVQLDMESSGEHFGTTVITPIGIINQGNDENTDEENEFMNSLIPYRYWYTPTCEGDIHVDMADCPERIWNIICEASEQSYEQNGGMSL